MTTPSARLALALVRDAIRILATDGRGYQHLGGTRAARERYRRRWIAETQAWVDGHDSGGLSLGHCADALGRTEAELRAAITSCVASAREA